MNSIYYAEQIPDIESFVTLYNSTGWNINGEKNKEQLSKAINNSWYFISAYFDDKLVGTGRIISDGSLHAFITEMIVSPDFHRKGIGKEILSRLVYKALNHGINDIQLFCAQGKEEFYLKNGFEKRMGDAPGMQYKVGE